MLGHYSAGFTLDTYTHVTAQMQRAAADKMGGFMENALPGESVNANLKMSIFAETKCNFSPVSTEVYTALIHHITCRLEARQALIYQLVLGLTGENGKYNYSRAVHICPPFFDIPCSAKNYKIAPALTVSKLPAGFALHRDIRLVQLIVVDLFGRRYAI
ncbi:MAG: hypothetical protein K2K53_07420 [Oscillospiraceae bacterium]|nr:hypothetical protein [Oscillospiraceae bacterium]